MDRATYRRQVEHFIDSSLDRHTLGLVYGRRRIGKSTMLESIAHDRGGFYWEATRADAAIQLARLGEAVGDHLGAAVRLAFDSWDDAIRQLLGLGANSAIPVVLDEFGYVLESDPSVASILASALGPAGRRRNPGQSRVILCGSAIAMLSSLTAGQAPLRGRAGMELVMQPSDFREAAEQLGTGPDLELAVRVFAVIGGVIGYATDMVDYDLPTDQADFDRWVAVRLLSPAATLHHEAMTLLAEDPTLATANPAVHHSILGAIANGTVTAGKIANQLRRSGQSIEPAVKRLISAGFIIRHNDPIRANRPMYSLADPFLQFHYAVLEPHAALLRERDQRKTWERLSTTFDSRVRGPVFEEQARSWVRRYAAEATVGGPADYVGPSVTVFERAAHQLDVVVATADSPTAAPGERTVLAIGEAKAGETVGRGHLRRLEQARSALGARAAQAKLLLFAPSFSAELTSQVSGRSDVELIDLERLYYGD